MGGRAPPQASQPLHRRHSVLTGNTAPSQATQRPHRQHSALTGITAPSQAHSAPQAAHSVPHAAHSRVAADFLTVITRYGSRRSREPWLGIAE